MHFLVKRERECERGNKNLLEEPVTITFTNLDSHPEGCRKPM